MLNRKYLELIRFKVFADLKAETKRTYMGILWWIFDPILFMATFYLVFGLLLRRGTENFVAFLLVGLVFWRWFQATVNGGSNSIVQGRALMRQVHLPKLLFPLVSVFSDLVKFALVLSLLLIFLWVSGFWPGIAYLSLPVVMLVQFGLIVAVTALVAALIPLVPDVKHLVTHSLQLLMFLSGIFYSVELIPPAYVDLFYLNPIAVLLTAYRDILMDNLWPPWSALGWIALLDLFILGAALLILRRLEYEYPKITS